MPLKKKWLWHSIQEAQECVGSVIFVVFSRTWKQQYLWAKEKKERFQIRAPSLWLYVILEILVVALPYCLCSFIQIPVIRRLFCSLCTLWIMTRQDIYEDALKSIDAGILFFLPCSMTVYKPCSRNGFLCPATSQPPLTRWRTTCLRFGLFHPQYCNTSLIWLTGTETQRCTTVCLTPTLALSRNCSMQVQSQGNERPSCILTTFRPFHLLSPLAVRMHFAFCWSDGAIILPHFHASAWNSSNLQSSKTTCWSLGVLYSCTFTNL